jgi:hypothetical protein
VESLGTRTSACVKVERLLLFISVEDFLQVSLAKENAPSNEPVDVHAGQILNSLDLLRGDWIASVLVYQLGVIDAFV